MQHTTLRANLLMLLTAAIWGFAFVAQKKGMEFVGPFTFNAARFFLGVVSLLPVIWFLQKRSRSLRVDISSPSLPFKPALILGLVLFGGASFQQVGMVHTTAGKAGFITGLYVLLVPFFGLFIAKKVSRQTWLAVIVAFYGMYLLSVKADAENFWSLEFGDLLVLCSAIFWAMHVLLIDHFVQKHDALQLSILQFFYCALLSLIVALIFEHIEWASLVEAKWSIIYAGCFSVGIAYTLQVVAQQEAHPTHAAIILSMEGVFAALGGWWLLSELMTGRMLLGCGLILAAMLLAQIRINQLSAA